MKKTVLKADLSEKAAEGKNHCDYMAELSSKLYEAIDDVLGSTDPAPVGVDSINALACASVFMLKVQTCMECKSVKTAKSVHKSSIEGMIAALKVFSEKQYKDDKSWLEIMYDEGRK